jgi:hypothetical protein
MDTTQPSIESYLGSDVIDVDGTAFGRFECYWEDQNRGIAFVGVKTACSSSLSIVPGGLVEANCVGLRIGTHRELIQHGPALSWDAAVSPDFESAVHDYYAMPKDSTPRRGVLRKRECTWGGVAFAAFAESAGGQLKR